MMLYIVKVLLEAIMAVEAVRGDQSDVDCGCFDLLEQHRVRCRAYSP